MYICTLIRTIFIHIWGQLRARPTSGWRGYGGETPGEGESWGRLAVPIVGHPGTGPFGDNSIYIIPNRVPVVNLSWGVLLGLVYHRLARKGVCLSHQGVCLANQYPT